MRHFAPHADPDCPHCHGEGYIGKREHAKLCECARPEVEGDEASWSRILEYWSDDDFITFALLLLLIVLILIGLLLMDSLLRLVV